MSWLDLPRALLIALIVFTCLYLANRLYDYGVPHWVSRKVAHLGGGFAFLLCPFLFSAPWWPLALSGGFTGLLLGARIRHPSTFRGTGGSGRPGTLAEVNFPLAGTVSILVLWAGLGEPMLAVLPPAFMGIGDAVTGTIRSARSKVENKGWEGSAGMLVSCLLLASLASPFWVGGVGAVVATMAEKVTRAGRFLDDNLTLTLGSAGVLAALVLLGAT